MPHIMPHSTRLVLCKMNRAVNAVCTYTATKLLLRDTVALNDSCLSPVKKQNRVNALTKEIPAMERQDP